MEVTCPGVFLKAVICPSVKHTGHHFMMNQIFKPEYIPTPPHKPDHINTRVVYTGHFEENLGFNGIWSVMGCNHQTFIPLRHPARVLASFRSRGLMPVKYHPGFYFQWYTMMELCEYWTGLGRKILYLHLDDLNIRESQSIAMLKNLDIAYKFNRLDWGINETNGCKQGNHSLEITSEMEKEIPVDMLDFYYSTRPI